MTGLRSLFSMCRLIGGPTVAGTTAEVDADAHRRRPIYEPLEDRCLLSAAVWSSASVHPERVTALQAVTTGTDAGSNAGSTPKAFQNIDISGTYTGTLNFRTRSPAAATRL